MTHTFSCIGWQCLDMPQAPSHYANIVSPKFSRARRPALIPSNCSLSATETEDLIKKRTQQLPFPNPNPDLLQDIRPSNTTPISDTSFHTARKYREVSPTSDYDLPSDTTTLPSALVRRPEHRDVWLKARAQCARNRKLKYFTFTQGEENLETHAIDLPPVNSKSPLVGPKRKHSSFVQELDYKCFLEDRAGTPHISNLFTDDDVSAQLNVEELSVGGEIAAVELEGKLMGEAATAESDVDVSRALSCEGRVDSSSI